MKTLKEQLNAFVKSSLGTDIFKTTLRQIRDIYRPREKYPKTMKLKFHIFNSIYNRIPNFKVKSVLIDKMEYAFRIGTGIASYNTLPLTWLQDSIITFKNFLMKDRGHITTLICWNYEEQYQISTIKSVVNKMSKFYKGVENWKDNLDLSKAVEILKQVEVYLVTQEKKQLKTKLIKRAKCTVSLSDICDNVPAFDKNLQDTPIAIEARKESVWTHTQEILGINNLSNKWLEFQKAFLDWTRSVMQKEGSDDYFRSVLNIDTLRERIDMLVGWNVNSGFSLLIQQIKAYKTKVAQYSEIAPLRLLGVRRKHAKFTDRHDDYYVRNQHKILEQLESIFEVVTTFKSAEEELVLADMIICNKKWEDFVIKQKELVQKHKGGSTDTHNLEEAKVQKEDFGLACIDAVMELCSIVPGMEKRNPKEKVDNVVEHFVDALIVRLEEVCDNETLFSQKKTMSKRFKHIIEPAHKVVSDQLTSGAGTSKEKLFRSTLTEVKSMLNGQSKFTITFPTDDHTITIPKLVEIDFDAPQIEDSGLDLGKKNHSLGYTSTNVFAQIVKENRAHNGDYDITTLTYWKATAKANVERVKKFEKQLFDNDDYHVLADAKRLYNQLHPEDIK